MDGHGRRRRGSAASAAPDIDTLGSTIGRVFAPVARRIERRFGHRTITHCYAAQGAVAALALPLRLARAAAHLRGHRRRLHQPPVSRHLDRPGRPGLLAVVGPPRRLPLLQPPGDGLPHQDGQPRRCLFRHLLRLPHHPLRGPAARRLPALRPPRPGRRLGRGPRLSRLVGRGLPRHRRGRGLGPAALAPARRHASRRSAPRARTRSSSATPRTAASSRSARPTPPTSSPTASSRTRARASRSRAARSTSPDASSPTSSRSCPPARTARPVRHLIDGQVTVAEAAGVTPDEFRFDTVTGGDRHLSFQFATLADIERLDLSGLVVEQGTVTLRVYTPEGPGRGLRPAGHGALRRPPRRVRARALARRRDCASRRARRSPSATRSRSSLCQRSSTARLDVSRRSPTLPPHAPETPPASSSPVAMRARLDAAQADARRVADRHAEGFASRSAVDAAQADADGLRAQIAASEATDAARAGEWQRTHAERIRQADARLRRARQRHRQAVREATVLSTGAGVVRRIETRDVGPDRAEVRVILVSDRSTARSASGPSAASPSLVPP